jgi:CSLREA domain-containing protein/LPXTG-motif cell wall-anchored protein
MGVSMRPRPRVHRLLAATAAGAIVAALGFAPPAQAADITVTTATDVVNGADGQTSLREAISEANAAAGPTTIVLAAATDYQLTICGAAVEDANADGDLDHTSGQNLTIEGHGATITQTCDDQRILHSVDTMATTVTVNDATLTGGEGNAAAVQFGNNLVLNRTTVTGNDAGADGTLNDDPAESGTSLSLNDSTVGPNVGIGVRITFGSVAISHSTITKNTLSGVALIDGALSVSDSTVTDNGEHGLFTSGQGSGTFPFTNSVARNNGGVGVYCSNCGDLTITNSKISKNQDGGVRFAIDTDAAGEKVTLTATSSSIFDNTKAGRGAGIALTITELADDAAPSQIVIDKSTISGNSATGADGRGGAIHAATGEVRIKNSTVGSNTASVSGGGVEPLTGDAFLQHATIVENSAPLGANLNLAEGLHAFGSIVAAGGGAGDDCEVGGSTTSTGYNVGSDGTCGFTGVGDQNSVADPGLAPLKDNGGPTLTRLPLSSSPAHNAVPAAACTVLTVDQRGTARPQGTACEAGATEINLDGSGGLPVTGAQVGGIVIVGVLLLVLGALALVLVRRRQSRLAR